MKKVKDTLDLLRTMGGEYSDYLEHSRGADQVPETEIIIPAGSVPIPKGPTKKKLTKAQRKKVNSRKNKRLNKKVFDDLVSRSKKIYITIEDESRKK